MADEPDSNAKENLPIRQNLVDIAVGFLVNPSVKQKPDVTKIAFLKQKGLTDTEIDEAFSKVQYESGTVVSGQAEHSVNPYPLPPYRIRDFYLYRFWSYSSAFVSLATAIYVMHRFYKLYIEPWLFGSKSEMSEIAALKEQLVELNNSISQLSSKVSSLEEAVNNQMHQTSLYSVESGPKSFGVILDELSNMKGLLVNRYNYPPLPPVGLSRTEGSKVAPKAKASIPKWQLRDFEPDKSKMGLKEQTDESKDETKYSSEHSCLDNTLSSREDQMQDHDHNLIIAKDKIQDNEAKVVSENYVDVLNDKNEIEAKLKVASGKMSEDSGVELHNSKSTD